ncbi:MAG: nuclease [Gemmatimonadetes bacterium]|nr:nuclease [Gemmatimonadota bacterium]
MPTRRSFARLPALPLALALVAATPSAVRWGDAGHRIVGELAARALPADMPAFFRNAGADLAWLNPEPDRWRDFGEQNIDPALGSGSGFDHFVDFEGVPDDAFKAKDRYEYLAAIKAAGFDHKVGFLPFRITELAQTLRVDFRLWRAAVDEGVKRRLEARIINDAGILGHYVADGANPHHTTIHHNGWVGPNPDGYATDTRMHGRFEAVYVQSHLAVADVAPLVTAPAAVAPNIREATMAYLRTSAAQLRPLYDLDKVEKFDTNTTAATHKAFVAARLAAGATMLRDLWWTAWVTSGQPTPGRPPRE